MNFKHMPELETQYGYAFALLTIVLSAILPMLFFRWRKWL
jgi:magnesium transporter